MDPVAPTRRTILGTAAGLGVLPLRPTAGRAVQPAAADPDAHPEAPGEPPRMTSNLTINGQHMALSITPDTTLLDALREQTDLTGTKKGCDHGSCGACTVHIDGQRVLACLTLAARCEGKAIRTIE